MTLPIPSLRHPQSASGFRFVPFCEIEGLLAWTPREIAEFRRAEAKLHRAGKLAEVKFGQSQDGHPWCVFLLTGAPVPSAYFAFLDGRYVADWDGLPGALETGELRNAIDLLLATAADLPRR